MKENRSLGLILIALGAIIALIILLAMSLLFWQERGPAVLDPSGQVAAAERDLIIDSTLLMLIVVIPVFIITFSFAWWYRENNKKAAYHPDFEQHPAAEFIWWGVPIVIIAILSHLTWIRTHELDPFKPLDVPGKPLVIQAVALNWKWLFLYPEQGVATLSHLKIPEKTAISFEITADAPMNSLWIPRLGGQMYAMPGMVSKLHLIADESGIFEGRSSNLSGKGFAGMTFQTEAVTKDEFNQWMQSVKTKGESLTLHSYQELAKPSEYVPAKTYKLEKGDLFRWIVMKYIRPNNDDS